MKDISKATAVFLDGVVKNGTNPSLIYPLGDGLLTLIKGALKVWMK